MSAVAIEQDFQGLQISSPMAAARRPRVSPRDFMASSQPDVQRDSYLQWPLEDEEAVITYSPTLRDSTFRDRPITSRSDKRKMSNASSFYSAYSLYPAPSKPLPPVPSSGRPSLRLSSQASSDRSSIITHRSSQMSGSASSPDIGSVSFSPPPRKAPLTYRPPEGFESYLPSSQQVGRQVDLVFWKMLSSDDKKKGCIFYLDMSSNLSTLASKHGNNIIKIWSTAGGTVQTVLKISAYCEAQCRSRDYLIRSHAILSEPTTLIAIASRFGRCIEIWNWSKKKCLQSIDDADRWTSAQIESYESGLSSFAVYHGEKGTINLYSATREKKPFVKNRTIDLAQAGLPFVPQYPELSLSKTSPLLVIAAGPRPPRPGHPPPERETLLAAWETHQNGDISNKPYRVARPWQHKELDTAIPMDLVTYGSYVVSIWIPATFRAVATPASRGGGAYNLMPVAVPHRFVLVWDLAANSTRTFGIPNTTSCVSPDCRFVAYCHASGTDIGARGTLAILDVITGKEVWCWPDRDALAIDSGPKAGFEQFDDLSCVTDLCFSADGKFLCVGDSEGYVGLYEVRDQSGEKVQLQSKQGNFL